MTNGRRKQKRCSSDRRRKEIAEAETEKLSEEKKVYGISAGVRKEGVVIEASEAEKGNSMTDYEVNTIYCNDIVCLFIACDFVCVC